MIKVKEEFLKNDLIPLLEKLDTDEKARWGIMTPQQMIEHFADAIKNASGRLLLPTLNEGEKLQKSREFLMSEIPFEKNIDNPLIPKEGMPHRQPDLRSAINKLKKELDYFFWVFEKNPDLKTGNAFFGQLNYNVNIQLLHKHAVHHLKQFGVEPKEC